MIEQIWDIVLFIKPIIGSLLVLVGCLLAIVGTIGVLRFPDLYTRLHAASVTDTSAATLAIVGMALLAPSWAIVIKLAAVWLFLFLTGPTSSHALANAAHTAGLEPMIGPQGKSDDSDDGAPK